MYSRPNNSSDSFNRRFSSNNPFRQASPLSGSPAPPLQRGASVQSSNSAFDDWIEKNRSLIEDSEEDDLYQRPSFPTATRHGSDTDVNYRSASPSMSSNNPFASAMSGEYVHHRDPPPPPRQSSSSSRTRPPRPPRDSKGALAPPSYEEAAGPSAASRDYPREKSSSSSSRPHRSHSDSARHRHRHDRHDRHDRHERSRRSHKSSSRHKSPKKPEPHNSEGLDTIDKLDVSAFFGGRFHHDGPFDACTPHRNKNAKAAPVMAFPADGPNNSMKAVNHNEKNSHIYLAFGEGYDQNEIVGTAGPGAQASGIPKTNKTSDDPQSIYTPKENPSVTAFDANIKAEPVHGSTTAGLGSSTFLDGAPAPRGDDFLSPPSGGGLGRKKSLVQRLRKNSGSDAPSSRSSNDADEYRSSFGDEDPQSSSLLRRVKSLKVGRR